MVFLEIILGGVYNAFFQEHIQKRKSELENALNRVFINEQYVITNIRDGSGRALISKAILATVLEKKEDISLETTIETLEKKGMEVWTKEGDYVFRK